MNRLRTLLPAVLAAAALSSPAGAQGVVEYFHLDALGSVRAVSNQAGVLVERHDYLPFGEECTTGPCATNPPGTNTFKFTGKERDQESGLDYFGARYYGSRLARFTSVDPVYTWNDNLVDPQRWNRYAHGRNNPLRYVDPDGRAIKGHHYVPKQIYENIAGLSDEAFEFFRRATTDGPIPGDVHKWNQAHIDYSGRVQDLWNAWSEAKHIDPSRMTAGQANQFLEHVAADPHAKKYLNRIHSALGTRLGARIRWLGRVAKVLLIASVAETLMAEGVEAAAHEAAEDVVWPIPIPEENLTKEERDGARNMGAIMRMGLEGPPQ
jgi:RHS repeat-associated protein